MKLLLCNSNSNIGIENKLLLQIQLITQYFQRYLSFSITQYFLGYLSFSINIIHNLQILNKCIFLLKCNLLVASLRCNDAVAKERSRRRFGQSTKKVTSDENIEKKTLAEQVISASTHTEPNKHRRGGAYSADTGGKFHSLID